MPSDDAQAWQELRALRATPMGHAVKNAERRAVSAAALRQSQELADAAGSAGYATKALPLFYCLGQGIRAVAAARIEDDAWRVVGHGASVEPRRPLLGSIVRPRPNERPTSRDAFTAIQLIEEADPMTEAVTLAEIWAAIPEAPQIDLEPGLNGYPALTLHLPPFEQIRNANSAEGRLEVAAEGLSCELTDAELAVELSRYPTLAGGEGARRFIEGSGRESLYVTSHPQPTYDKQGRILDLSLGRPWIEHAPVLTWALDGTGEETRLARFEQVAPLEIERRPDARMAFPTLGGSDSPGYVSLWWALLLGLSTLVRYEPALWTEAIDPDTSKIAVPLEQACDRADWLVPRVVLLALRDVDSVSVA